MSAAGSRPVRFALVGCGQIAEAHRKAIDTVDGAALTWCQDIDEERARVLAERTPGARSTTDYADLLAADDVDVVFLCLPHRLHEPFSIQASQAGRHVLVEKPMAMDEAEAQRMIDAADEGGVHLMVGQSTRCMSSWRRARQLAAEGAIGHLRHVLHQRMWFVERVSTDWRRTQAECGGLYLPLFGSHDIDAVLWAMGAAAGEAARPSRVFASIRALSDAFEGDSDGIVSLDFADGRLATFQFSTTSRHVRTETIFVGERGTLTVERSRVRLNGDDVPLDVSDGDYADAFAEQIRQVVAALRGQGPPPAPGSEVLTVVRTLDLARASADTGTPQAF